MNIQSNMHHDVTIQRNLKKGLYNAYRIMKVDTILTIYHLSHFASSVKENREYLEKTTDLPKVIDKIHHLKLYNETYLKANP
jgi:hypothetical protein